MEGNSKSGIMYQGDNMLNKIDYQILELLAKNKEGMFQQEHILFII